MQGKSHLTWVVFLLAAAQATTRLAAAQEFVYTKYSCEDLIPRHRTEILRLMGEEEGNVGRQKMGSNHVNTPGKGEAEGSGSTTGTTVTAVPEPEMYEGDVEVKVLTSETKYRRLKTLEVTIQSSDYINGFLLQARKVDQLQDLVGSFLEAPHRGNIISCNKSMGSTVVMEMAPLRLANLTFTWLAPEANVGSIEFVASVLLERGTLYQILTSDPLELNMYPVSTSQCAVTKSCFRYCMLNGGPKCPAHMARYTATLEYFPRATNTNKTSVRITIGGQLTDSNGYLAVGFSQDYNDMNAADLTVCYLEGDNTTVGIEHYLLKNMDYTPDLHLGELQLESADVDRDYVWCTFLRPITGEGHNLLPLTEPHYYYYFWGSRNGTTINLPPVQDMMRSDKLISTTDNMFNYIMYGSATSRQAPYSVVAAALLLVGMHFMCW